ncbi:5-methyltetrahydropteroyltriglutamate--homocysteine S-methyltransferase [Flammeovirga agarivorans]|uniref:5-methyltetrahydropteroyltriglutamate--homocysteine methyltransferase n=1 Tax=Flammeovirga agarivorans TaxID=2726742 RepID=A0A7X8XVB4_9BACT|nr:5-methyltetrahydropteroyltriglutamate--homocysteine S-methyltransferase [Flammeovirga agarivorans]NLR91202.1 5-methyltetrahydropteroyltriglutamate--homocysteine S-methyltransferase [Flammeovirga agarivorans]
MKITTLGYPRIGKKRELKKANEQFWAGKINEQELQTVASELKAEHWNIQKENLVEQPTSNDFSFYDQVLDLIVDFNCIPKRFQPIHHLSPLQKYFALARGYQDNELNINAMSMTKWFDTNYHYIVPEFYKKTHFKLSESPKAVQEYTEAKAIGIDTKVTLIGPLSFLLLGKEKEQGFHRLELIHQLKEEYIKLLNKLCDLGATEVQFHEPILAKDYNEEINFALKTVYNEFKKRASKINVCVVNFFDCYGDYLPTILQLPLSSLHLDLTRCGEQLKDVLSSQYLNNSLTLSLGVVDGRNIWKNDFKKSLQFISSAIDVVGKERIEISTSCSLLHVPYDLELEESSTKINQSIIPWLSFAKQKLQELKELQEIVESGSIYTHPLFIKNQEIIQSRKDSDQVHHQEVKNRVDTLIDTDALRSSPFKERKEIQKNILQLPLLPTTTIGSFPQTKEVRQQRNLFIKGKITKNEYDTFLKEQIKEAILFQEQIDMDVLVHGEFERNDMVEYFGEQLEGVTFSSFGWVQSYGSRCVKPPIIFGDVSRKKPMTVEWTSYAQSLTNKPVKGMLTGPITILQWSFVRDDQPRKTTCEQISLAIRDEVLDLEAAGIKVIQIDEPALREGLPLRKDAWEEYLTWAVNAFRISSCGVNDATQIHTHMCYSQFNDIIQHIANLDADVITIECSRAQMKLLDAFSDFRYPNEIGPGVYDIHSPNVPSKYDIIDFINKAKRRIPVDQLWVNPDCGLKTRGWKETKAALEVMVEATQKARELFEIAV